MPARPNSPQHSSAAVWALLLLQPARTMREAGRRESWESLPAYGLWWGLLMTLALLLPPGLRGQLHWRMAPPLGWFLTYCLVTSLAAVSTTLLAGAFSLAARLSRFPLPIKTALVVVAWSAAPAPIALSLLSALNPSEEAVLRTGGALLSQTAATALPILLAGTSYSAALLWLGLRGTGCSRTRATLILGAVAALAVLAGAAVALLF